MILMASQKAMDWTELEARFTHDKHWILHEREARDQYSEETLDRAFEQIKDLFIVYNDYYGTMPELPIFTPSDEGSIAVVWTRPIKRDSSMLNMQFTIAFTPTDPYIVSFFGIEHGAFIDEIASSESEKIHSGTSVAARALLHELHWSVQ
jgi:hypothetical protein